MEKECSRINKTRFKGHSDINTIKGNTRKETLISLCCSTLYPVEIGHQKTQPHRSRDLQVDIKTDTDSLLYQIRPVGVPLKPTMEHRNRG